MAILQGSVRKMHTHHDTSVQYQLPIGDALLPVNDFIGQTLQIEFSGAINCIACGREIKKTFQQGYCFPCMRSLPQTDQCIVRPELCHFHLGTCRDEAWGKANCMQTHFLYIANSSALKVGITRGTNIPTRWMDQGATQALPIISTDTRLSIGKLEMVLKAYASDRTDWRKMLKGAAEPLDLLTHKHRILDLAQDDLAGLDENIAWTVLPDQDVYEFNYPVTHYPEKVSSLNLDKTPSFKSKLNGIKGQYLIFELGVINIRKYAGYTFKITTPD